MFTDLVSEPTSPADLHRLNLSRIMFHLHDHGPTARSQLAAATGLTRGAITALAGVLLEDGMIRESEQMLDRGRPSPMLVVDGSTKAVLAAEITIDRIRLLGTDLGGRPLIEEVHEHRAQEFSASGTLDVVATHLMAAIDRLHSDGIPLTRLVVVVPAPVIADRHVPAAIDLGWRDVDLRTLLSERLPNLECPLELAGDVIVGGWAEYLQVREELPRLVNTLYLKADTGIGGLQLFPGRTIGDTHRVGFAAGHVPIMPDGELCACGQRGCLVTVAGPEVELVASGLGDLMAQKGVTTALAEVSRRAAAGDPVVEKALHEVGRWIGQLISLMVMTASPRVVVLGGHWAEVFDQLLPGIHETAGLLMNYEPSALIGFELHKARLGDKANLRGALDQAIRASLQSLI